MQLLHERFWNAATSGDACPKKLKPFVFYFAFLKQAELFEEHGRHAVKCCTFFLLHGFQSGTGVE